MMAPTPPSMGGARQLHKGKKSELGLVKRASAITRRVKRNGNGKQWSGLWAKEDYLHGIG